MGSSKVGQSSYSIHIFNNIINRMIIAGLSGIIVVEIYAAVMQRIFQNTTNSVGKGFAILGIYLFVVTYYGMLNSTTWLYGAEVLPIALRSKVMGLAAASHFIVNVGRKFCSIIHQFDTSNLSQSYGSWTKCFCKHWRKLLLCFRRMLSFLPCDGVSLFPVSFSFLEII